MPLFGGQQQQSPAGPPSEALDRLQSGAFTSDLSVDELLCIESMGFDALGLVLGSSIYHIGWQRIRTTQNEELQVISRAMYDARRLAIHRMEQEAAAVDADGIIGVRMEISATTGDQTFWSSSSSGRRCGLATRTSASVPSTGSHSRQT